jgi:hypothetical protein
LSQTATIILWPESTVEQVSEFFIIWVPPPGMTMAVPPRPPAPSSGEPVLSGSPGPPVHDLRDDRCLHNFLAVANNCSESCDCASEERRAVVPKPWPVERRAAAGGGAGIEVFAAEPRGAVHPLSGLDAAILKPDDAALTAECAERMAIASEQNVLDFFAGRLDPVLTVNKDQIR